MYDPYRPSRTPQPGIAECTPSSACPVCGGLECLCRPRFFAGQLLTEADLNRLERYVVEKNKLHNRYLHGWGVVCGLEVVCHPCADRVTVRTGYALSPCGDDIIVCRDEVVDVCELIQKCRPPGPPGECLPPRSGSDEDCREVQEEWILAVCYDEKPSRGITALTGSSASACCSRCSGGGTAACGCGCQSHSYAPGGYSNGNGSRTQRRTSPQCEPTLICEGYTFIAYKAPPKNPASDRRQPQGELIERVLACATALLARLPQQPQGPGVTNEQLHAWCCELKETFLDFLVQQPVYDCTAYERLTQFRCPRPDPAGDPGYPGKLASALQDLVIIVGEYLRYCLCSALLPPCPPMVECNCVPLATVTVRKSDCHVLRVCNWGPRQQVVTFPHLGYWLSWTNIGERLRQMIESLCCRPFRRDQDVLGSAQPSFVGAAAPSDTARRSTMAGDESRVFSTLLSQSWLNRTRTVDARNVALGALGIADERGVPFATNFEIEHPVEFLLLNQVVRPTLEATLPDEWSNLMETLARGGGTPEAVSEEVATLRSLVAELQATVAAQGAVIEDLQRRMG